MLLELVEISFSQYDCPNISLSDNKDIDYIYIYLTEVLKDHENIYSTIVGDFSNYNLTEKMEKFGIKKIYVMSKTISKLEVMYTIGLTNAMKIISDTGSRLIPPLIVSNGIEKWVVLTLNKNKLISALATDPNTEIERVREINSEKFAKIFKSIFEIEGLFECLENFTRLQRNALIHAYNMGYYEWPRKCSLDELAALNGISKNAFLKRLRNAEKKIIKKILENFILPRSNGYLKKGQRTSFIPRRSKRMD